MEGERHRKEIDNPKYFTPEAKQRKGEIIMIVYYFSPKVKSHIKKCPEWQEETSTVDEKTNKLPDCEICNKFLCFLDLMLTEEFKTGKEMDFKKLQNSGVIDHMIFGPGIQILH